MIQYYDVTDDTMKVLNQEKFDEINSVYIVICKKLNMIKSILNIDDEEKLTQILDLLVSQRSFQV